MPGSDILKTCYVAMDLDQSVMNEKVFLATFEQRLKDEFIQKCFSDLRDSDRCRLSKEIKTVFGLKSYKVLVQYILFIT